MKEETVTDDEWKKRLTKEQYNVLRKKETEKSFTGKLLNNKERGTYQCAGCGSVLFSSDKKFDSGTGWPSFTNAKKGAVKFVEDKSHFMRRTEVICAKCGGHLGHVFDDGPQTVRRAGGTASGRRFCINSCAMKFGK